MDDQSPGTIGVAVVLLVVVTVGAVGAFQFASNGASSDAPESNEVESAGDDDAALESPGNGADGGGDENESTDDADESDGSATDGEDATNEPESDRSSDDGDASDGDGDGLEDGDDGAGERTDDTGTTESESNETVGARGDGVEDEAGDPAGTDTETAGDGDRERNDGTGDEPDYLGGMQVELVDVPPQLDTEGRTLFGVAVRSPEPDSGEAVLRLDGEVVDTGEYTTRADGSADYAEGGTQLYVDDPDVEAGETYPVTIETDHGDRTLEIRAREPIAQ